MPERLPSSSRVQVGGRRERFLVRLGSLTPKVAVIHGNRAEDGVDPADERKTPVGGVEADDAGAAGVELGLEREQTPGEGGVVSIGRPEQEHDRQAGASAEQGVDAEAAQEAAGMVRWSAALASEARPCGIGVILRQASIGTLSIMSAPKAPGAPMIRRRIASRTATTKSSSQSGAPACASRFHCCEAQGTRGRAVASRGKPQASAGAGQATSQ